MLCFITLTLQAQDVWTAAGSSTIFGSHWNETDTSNDLTDKGNGIWELTFTLNQATKEVSATAVPSVTDGISQIASDIKTKKVIFNLQGQRISAPKQGVYIINGRDSSRPRLLLAYSYPEDSDRGNLAYQQRGIRTMW